MKSEKPKRNEFVFIVVLALVAITLVTIALVPSLRGSVRQFVFPEKRVVLGKVTGAFATSGSAWTILKIQKNDQISLEIYQLNEEGQLALYTIIPLEDRKDGHFVHQGNALNLALIDVDKDGVLEIVAPTYNDQMAPRLNIFRHNKDSNSFDRATAPNDFKL